MTRLDGPLDELPPRLRAAVEKGLQADNVRKLKRRARLTANVSEADGSPEVHVRERTLAEFVLEIPVAPWSLNDERAGHWTEHRRRTEGARFAVRLLVPADQGAFCAPVEVEATPRGVKHDPGNSYPAVKAAIDGLVDAGVLADDTRKQVARIILNAPVDGEPGLILRVRLASV